MPWTRANDALIRRLGCDVTITPPGGGEAWFGRGVYRAPRTDSQNLPQTGRPDPELDIPEDAGAPLQPGCVVTVSETSRTFRLINHEPDDFGLLTLYLREDH